MVFGWFFAIFFVKVDWSVSNLWLVDRTFEEEMSRLPGNSCGELFGMRNPVTFSKVKNDLQRLGKKGHGLNQVVQTHLFFHMPTIFYSL